jgi:hypothetical protein
MTKTKKMTLSSVAADVMSISGRGTYLDHNLDMMDGLEMIPDYYATELNVGYLYDVNAYLRKAFNSPFHPLASLLSSLCDCYTATYVSKMHFFLIRSQFSL